jgi:hypothetical protein
MTPVWFRSATSQQATVSRGQGRTESRRRIIVVPDEVADPAVIARTTRGMFVARQARVRARVPAPSYAVAGLVAAGVIGSAVIAILEHLARYPL